MTTRGIAGTVLERPKVGTEEPDKATDYGGIDSIGETDNPGNRGVLLVSGSEEERSSITYLLHDGGYSVDAAATINRASIYLKENNTYGLLVFSEGTPEHSGTEPAQVSKALGLFMRVTVPVLYIVSETENRPRDILIRTLSGVPTFAVLRKPYSEEDLVSAVNKLYRG